MQDGSTEGTSRSAGGTLGLSGVPHTNDISVQYAVPPPEPFASFSDLKGRIRQHYELSSEYYFSLWGEHIHHGYFLSPSDTKESAQIQLIELLLSRSGFVQGSTVLDVGCGIGGTSRFLAREYGCSVTGITISGRQVEIAESLTKEDPSCPNDSIDDARFLQLGKGRVRFIELDAEKMGEHFTGSGNASAFDNVWISEALSHFPNKELFFKNAAMLLKTGGRLVIADWFRAPGLTSQQLEADIRPIEDGMLLPPLCEQLDYVRFAKRAGFAVFSEPLDISKNVSQTWDISWSLVQSPALWAYAFSQGRDGIAFLQAFRAMRRGFTNGTFCYVVMVFEK